MKRLDLTGETFGRLTAIKLSEDRSKGTRWICECSCGKITTVATNCLRTKNTVSCGCYCAEILSKRRKTHGHSGTKEYTAWRHILDRCLNEKSKKYKDYGGRGITICQEWLNNFESFLSHIGYAPTPKHTVDRIDVNGNYEPGNVRWATMKQQANNKTNNRIVDLNDGAGPMTFNQQAERLNIPRDRVKMRLLYGWSIEEAFKGEKRINQHG